MSSRCYATWWISSTRPSVRAASGPEAAAERSPAVATLLQLGLSNAVMAGALAVLAALASRLIRRPAVVHSLWLLVLLKLVTPPFVAMDVSDALPRQSQVADSGEPT